MSRHSLEYPEGGIKNIIGSLDKETGFRENEGAEARVEQGLFPT